MCTFSFLLPVGVGVCFQNLPKEDCANVLSVLSLCYTGYLTVCIARGGMNIVHDLSLEPWPVNKPNHS